MWTLFKFIEWAEHNLLIMSLKKACNISHYLKMCFSWFQLKIVKFNFPQDPEFKFEWFSFKHRCSGQNGSRSAYPVCHVDNNTMIPSPQVLEHHQISWEFWQYMLPLFGYIVVFRCLGYIWLRFVQKPH